MTAGTAARSCKLTPEVTEGPFYVALDRIRKDITEGRPGVPLTLKLRVDRREEVRSDPRRGRRHLALRRGRALLRRVLERDRRPDLSARRPAHQQEGLRHDQDVYPGHYTGRATHIHIKVHIGGKARNGTLRGGHVSHTGQLFFAESANSNVYALAPYSSDTAHRTLNASDSIYAQAGGTRSEVSLKRQRLVGLRRHASCSASTRRQLPPRSENLSPDESDDPGGGAGHAAAAAHPRDAEAGRAGAEQADRGLDRRPARRSTASRTSSPTSPICPSRSARCSATARPSACASPTARSLSHSGPPEGSGKVRDFLGETESFLIISGDALTTST